MTNLLRALFLLFLSNSFAIANSAHNIRSLRKRQNESSDASQQENPRSLLESKSPSTSLSENIVPTLSTFLSNHSSAILSSYRTTTTHPSVSMLPSTLPPINDISTTNLSPIIQPPAISSTISATQSNYPSSGIIPSLVMEPIFAKYPLCNICREGSILQFSDQIFEIPNSSIRGGKKKEMHCNSAYYGGFSGILTPEYCQLSKDHCSCIRQDLHRWPELKGMVLNKAIEKIKEGFPDSKSITFDVLLGKSEDNAVSSAVMIQNEVQFHIKLNDDGEKIISEVPTCYCGD